MILTNINLSLLHILEERSCCLVRVLMCAAVEHDVTDDYDAVSATRLKGHGGADFFAIDAFVHAVSVCC